MPVRLRQQWVELALAALCHPRKRMDGHNLESGNQALAADGLSRCNATKIDQHVSHSYAPAGCGKVHARYMTMWLVERTRSMRRLLMPIATAAVGLVMVLSGGEAQDRSETPKSDAITILTDSILEPSGPATLAIYNLVDQLESSAKIRVLPVAGLGAQANVRDLLSLRDIDIAVLNSDIFAFLDQTHEFPSARRQLRQLAHLYDQHVYLLARRSFNALEDLRGRSLIVGAQHGGSHITATALFGLQNIDVTLVPVGHETILDD